MSSVMSGGYGCDDEAAAALATLRKCSGVIPPGGSFPHTARSSLALRNLASVATYGFSWGGGFVRCPRSTSATILTGVESKTWIGGAMNILTFSSMRR